MGWGWGRRLLYTKKRDGVGWGGGGGGDYYILKREVGWGGGGVGVVEETTID